MSSEPMIRATGLVKRYRIGVHHPARSLREAISEWRPGHRRAEADEGWFNALDGVDLEVSRGEIVGILGANGAGKSTLLKILSRITRPDAGRVEMYGRVGSLLEVGTGFHPELTGRENIFLNGAILGMTRREIRQQFDAIVDFAEIEKFLDTPVKRYSSGMYVRLAFAVAAHLEPEILLVDEVLAVGDAAFQRKCLGKIDEVSTTHGRTVLLVTHNVMAAQQLCERVVVFEDGRIAFDGLTREAVHRYLGTDAPAQDDDAHGDYDVSDRRNDAVGHSVIVGLRILDESGEPTNDLLMRRPCSLEIDLDEPTAVNEPKVGVRLSNELGVSLLTFVTAVAPEAGLAPTMVLRIPRLPLRPGRYYVDIAVMDDSGVVDSLRNIAHIDVKHEGYDVTTWEAEHGDGPVVTDVEWSARAGEGAARSVTRAAR